MLASRLAPIAGFAERRRWWIVGACALLNALFVVREALFGSAHNGWIYQHGDDGPWYWTSAWAMASLHIQRAAVGFGWPYLLAPLAKVFGPNMADGLPAVIVLDVVVLGPLAVVGMYLLGERLAGRLFGLWCAAVWVVLPALALLLYRPKTRPSVIDSFLPTATGLNALSDFPSMVCAIFCAYLIMRTIDTGDGRDGALAGVALGFLVLLKPANGPLVLVGAAVLLLAFRFRALAAAALGAAPALLALVVWKRKGLGAIPILPSTPNGQTGANPGVGVGAGGSHGGGAVGDGGVGGAGGVSAPPERHTGSAARLYDRLDSGIHRYVNPDWGHFTANIHDLGDVFWSLRLLEFVLVAGSLAVLWRARWKGLVVVGWFLGYGLVKATSALSSIKDTSLYRYVLPAWPAWALLTAALIFLWPSGAAAWRRRRTADLDRAGSTRPVSRALLVTAVAAFAVLPLGVALALRPVPRATVAQQDEVGSPVPVVDSFGLTARTENRRSVRLQWSDVGTDRAAFAYRIFRTPESDCDHSGGGPPMCEFRGIQIASTKDRRFVDTSPIAGAIYRVGLAAGWSTEQQDGNLLLLSRPVSVSR